MVARVARFEGVNVQEAQRTMEQADAIIRPLVQGLAGYRGNLQLVSEGGGFMSITFFDSDADAASAESVFDEEMPKQLGDLFAAWGGTRVEAARYLVVQEERA